MSLKEKAIAVYRKEEEECKEKEQQEIKEFAEAAAKEFERHFREKPDKIIPEDDWSCIIECDGLRFKAKRDTCRGSRFYLGLVCSECNRYFETEVMSLEHLGFLLSRKPLCQNCAYKISRRREIIKKLEEVLVLIKEE